MATLSTTAWVLHDLGLAAGFGGNLFGQLALNPAVSAVQSKRERGRVAHVAWARYKNVNALSLAAFAGTWIIGRAFLHVSGREVGRASRNLTVLKDGLVAGALASGVGAMVAGTMLERARMQAGEPPIETGTEASWGTPPKVARLLRATSVLGVANVVFDAAVLATTTILAMKAGKSSKWTLFAKKLLP
jgi:hypothetical protein